MPPFPFMTCFDCRKSWPRGHESRKAGLVPHLGSTVLVEGSQVSRPQGENTGELTLPLLCHEVAWVAWRCPVPPHP